MNATNRGICNLFFMLKESFLGILMVLISKMPKLNQVIATVANAAPFDI